MLNVSCWIFVWVQWLVVVPCLYLNLIPLKDGLGIAARTTHDIMLWWRVYDGWRHCFVFLLLQLPGSFQMPTIVVLLCCASPVVQMNVLRIIIRSTVLQKFIAKVTDLFTCICCQEIVYQPVTTECTHNICRVRETIFFCFKCLFFSSLSLWGVNI